MRRATLLVLALVVGVLAATAPAPAAKKQSARKAEIVCFKKTVKADGGRKVRKTVCRPRRTPARRAPASAPAPLRPAVSAPTPSGPSAPIAIAPPAPGPAVGAGSSPAAPACVAEDTEWLTVTAYDLDQQFRLRFSRTCLRAGRTIVQYRNDDAQDHDLYVEGVAPAASRKGVVPSVAPGAMVQADVQLSAGTWRFFCDIAGHGSMTRTLTVAAG
jgi:hypothetical protein